MHCPFCNSQDTKVVDSRLAGEGTQVRRRRECLDCEERFSTFETPVLEFPFVVKSNGVREPFNEEKLRSGFVKALEKRPVSTEDIETAVSKILRQLHGLGEREVSSRLVGEMVMQELSILDQVGYVRFASIYREFEDVEAFRKEIDELEKAAATGTHRIQMSLLPKDKKKR